MLIDPLTDRERDVLLLMSKGHKYKEIGEILFISQNTVRYHVKAIYRKFNVNNRTQALEKARKFQII
jgi:LuxR family maltose regulon positive regulatory protein